MRWTFQAQLRVHGKACQNRGATMTDLLLLCRRPRGYTARRLVESARALGHSARAIPPGSLDVTLGARATLRRKGTPLAIPAALHVRCGPADLPHALTLGESLVGRGARVMNRLDVLASLQSPLGALARLVPCGIPVLPSVTLHAARDVDRAIFAVGGLPVVLRSSAPGRDGASVVGRTRAGTRAAAQVLLQWQHGVVMQRAVNPVLRSVVIMGGCVATVQQLPHVVKVKVPAAVTSLAERTAGMLGLDVAGVDVALCDDGPCVLSVSPAPALEAIEALCDVDAAMAMARAWAAIAGLSSARALDVGGAL